MGRSIFLGRNHPQICRDLCILNPFSDLFFAFKVTISRHFAGYASVALETIWLHEPRDLIFLGPPMTLLCLSRYSNANTVPGHSDARFCPGCGKSPHNRTECSAWGKICFKCDKRNHFANVCRSTATNTNLVVNVEQPLSQTDADLCNDTYALNLYNTNTQHSDSVKPYVCTINVCSTPVILEIDTGSSVTLLSHTEWARIKEKAPKLTLDTQNVPCLRTYSGHNIQPLGRTLLDVYHNDTRYQLYALVVPGTGPNLLGRDWLSVLQLNWAKLYVDETVQPRHCKPRPVPLAMRAKVESELYRPQEEGVIRPVEFSEWVAPIVPVLKASGDIRICDDYKVTINQAVKVDKHPSSRISHADCMSRLPLPDTHSHVPVPQEVVLALSTSVLLIHIEGQASLDDQSTICQVSNRRDTHSGYYVTVGHRIRESPSFIPAQHRQTQFGDKLNRCSRRFQVVS